MLYPDMLILTDIGSRPCKVRGYPSYSFHARAGRLPIVQERLSGQGPVPIRTITLDPGGSASATLATVGRECESASPPSLRAQVTSMTVTLPNGVEVPVTGLDNAIVPCGTRPLLVYPLVAGDVLGPPGENPYGSNQ